MFVIYVYVYIFKKNYICICKSLQTWVGRHMSECLVKQFTEYTAFTPYLKSIQIRVNHHSSAEANGKVTAHKDEDQANIFLLFCH